MNEEQITEAAAVVQVATGVSAYLHGIGYSLDKFKEELRVSVDHIKDQSKAAPCE
jgi:hypothetical protein